MSGQCSAAFVSSVATSGWESVESALRRDERYGCRMATDRQLQLQQQASASRCNYTKGNYERIAGGGQASKQAASDEGSGTAGRHARSPDDARRSLGRRG